MCIHGVNRERSLEMWLATSTWYSISQAQLFTFGGLKLVLKHVFLFQNTFNSTVPSQEVTELREEVTVTSMKVYTSVVFVGWNRDLSPFNEQTSVVFVRWSCDFSLLISTMNKPPTLDVSLF